MKLNFRFAAVHLIVHKKLHMKRIVVCWFPHNLTEHQKGKWARICKETLNLLNYWGHGFISKIKTCDRYRFLMYQHTEKVKYLSLKMISKE